MAVFLACIRVNYTSHSARLPVFYLQLLNLESFDLSAAQIRLNNRFHLLKSPIFDHLVSRFDEVCFFAEHI